MNDSTGGKSAFPDLFTLASGQHGFFTAAQAREIGIRDNLLAYHAKTGRVIRVLHGVYRLRDYPSSPREDVVAAWLALGQGAAVVSHESALDLHDLSDVIPDAVHLTVPRSKRNHPDLPGVKIHTTSRPFGPGDVTVRDGIRVTSVARTIADTAETGTAPEQVVLAIDQAMKHGMTTRTRLEQAVSQRSRRVQNLVHSAFERAA